jgi:hypothetical protein
MEVDHQPNDVIRREERAPFALPSLTKLKEIVCGAVDSGLVTWSKRFQSRCRLHQISTVDAVNVIRSGRVVDMPHYDLGRRAWRIHLEDAVDGLKLIVDVALGCEDDFRDAPRVEIVTASFRKGRGRQEVADWSK